MVLDHLSIHFITLITHYKARVTKLIPTQHSNINPKTNLIVIRKEIKYNSTIFSDCLNRGGPQCLAYLNRTPFVLQHYLWPSKGRRQPIATHYNDSLFHVDILTLSSYNNLRRKTINVTVCNTESSV